MKRYLLALILTAISTAQGTWHLEWELQADQYEIVVVTECKNAEKPIYIYDAFGLVDIGQEEADVRQQPTPRGERCTVTITVMVSADSGLTEAATDQSTIVIQEN
jgi:hypothetical protein